MSSGAATAGMTAASQRAIYRGVSAAEEAEVGGALPAAAPLAWLTQQGYTNRSVSERHGVLPDPTQLHTRR